MNFFSDSNLNNPIVSITTNHDTASSTPVISSVFFGIADGTKKLVASSNPNVDLIVMSITDLNVGTGADASEYKLSLSQAGLVAAVAGNPLSMATEVVGGAAGAVQIWIEVLNVDAVVGTSNDISISTNQLDIISI